MVFRSQFLGFIRMVVQVLGEGYRNFFCLLEQNRQVGDGRFGREWRCFLGGRCSCVCFFGVCLKIQIGGEFCVVFSWVYKNKYVKLVSIFFVIVWLNFFENVRVLCFFFFRFNCCWIVQDNELFLLGLEVFLGFVFILREVLVWVGWVFSFGVQLCVRFVFFKKSLVELCDCFEDKKILIVCFDLFFFNRLRVFRFLLFIFYVNIIKWNVLVGSGMCYLQFFLFFGKVVLVFERFL